MTSFTVDTTGSFIRPQVLRDARDKHEKKEISDKELQKIEDEEIKKLVDEQVAAGLKVVGDGEFRRWGYFFFINLFIFYFVYLVILKYF
jgi:methionine synthase II (cobalamin-independent)